MIMNFGSPEVYRSNSKATVSCRVDVTSNDMIILFFESLTQMILYVLSLCLIFIIFSCK